MELKRKIEDISDSKDLIDEVLRYFDGANDYDITLTQNEKSPPDLQDDDLEGLKKDADGFYIYPGDQVPDSFFDLINRYEIEKKARLEGVQWSSAVGEKGVELMPALKEGNVTKRKDGRWMGRYYENGSQKAVYAATKPECIDKVNTYVQLRDQDAETDRRGLAKKITLKEYITVWFDEWKLGRNREKPLTLKSIQAVEYTLLKYVGGHKLANKPLLKITADDIEKIIDAIPTKYVQAKAYNYLNRVLDKAHAKEIIKKNPIVAVERRAKPTAKKQSIPGYESWQAFLVWLKDRSIDTYYLAKFISDSGLRIGEALALTWKDINLETMRITINKSFDISNHTLNKTTKTDAGFRSVPIFPDALEVLKELPRNKKSEFVLWMSSKWTCAKKFSRIAKEFGLNNLSIHGLRHYFASQCLANGIDKKTYSLWLGHENIDISADYSHVTSDFERDQIALMAKRGRK